MSKVLGHVLVGAPVFGGTASSVSYQQQVINLIGADLLAYWRLLETSGTVAADTSGNNRTGAYTGVDLANAAGPKGGSVPYFDGANDYVNIYTASFSTAFTAAPNAGTAIVWAKRNGATSGYALAITHADNTQRIQVSYTNGTGLWTYTRVAGGVTSTVTQAQNPSDWTMIGITWSAADNRMRAYLNGAQVGTDQATGTWSAGALSSARTLIGARINTPTEPFTGWLAETLVAKRELTATEMSNLYTWS